MMDTVLQILFVIIIMFVFAGVVFFVAWASPHRIPGRKAGRRQTYAAAPPDLATRVRLLKQAGRIEQAIFLVRGETGMGQDEAIRFINAL
ncbi:hypothetical protein [Nonomuraea sp. JJY05]|uniref:hypothetical protein n=1 Tax=Nonomuraea sp. JJY05 TaxID=3350255 RepID=UPI00373EE430